MIAMLISATAAFTAAIFGTAYAIRVLRAKKIGQFIQEELSGHMHKRGTPTMGGIAIVGAIIIGYLASLVRIETDGGFSVTLRGFTGTGFLVIGAVVGMGLIGFIDDYQKHTKSRNRGLGKAAKFIGQLAIAGMFAWGAVALDANTALAFTRPTSLNLGVVFFAVLALLLLTGFANAVNITDGLDGLASGSSALVASAYVIIAFWIFRHPSIYQVEGSLDLAAVAAAMLGACLGFLWWNTAPAKIIMGDVGSQALGGCLAALALLTNTHLLLPVLGGLYVIETMSVIIQVVGFRWFGGRRLFRMAPIHHHFELLGWPETTVITRLWIIAAAGVAVGLGIFYADFLAAGGTEPAVELPL